MSNPGAPALLSSSHNMQGVTTLHARRNNMQGVTFCKFLFEKSADFEVQFLALQEEIDGIFLSYIVVHGIPWVCEALAKSRHEFSQKSQSCKKLRLACSLFNMQGVTYCITEANSVEIFAVDSFLAEKQTSKVEIPLFWGFVLPSDFPKSGGDPV